MASKINRNAFWLLQIGALLALALWATLDPVFELMVYRIKVGFQNPIDAIRDALLYVGAVRVVLLLSIFGVCITTLLAKTFVLLQPTGNLNSDSGRSISLKAVLGIVTLFAAWCGLAVNYSSVAMQARGIRVGWEIEELEALAAPLRDNWPQVDGTMPGIGPFMAYPFGKPSTLILLEPPQIADGKLTVSTIERARSGAIRLLLGSASSGTDYGEWVEWHPQGSHPDSFIGGLDDYHALRSSVFLGAGWFLVRYDA